LIGKENPVIKAQCAFKPCFLHGSKLKSQSYGIKISFELNKCLSSSSSSFESVNSAILHSVYLFAKSLRYFTLKEKKTALHIV